MLLRLVIGNFHHLLLSILSFEGYLVYVFSRDFDIHAMILRMFEKERNHAFLYYLFLSYSIIKIP